MSESEKNSFIQRNWKNIKITMAAITLVLTIIIIVLVLQNYLKKELIKNETQNITNNTTPINTTISLKEKLEPTKPAFNDKNLTRPQNSSNNTKSTNTTNNLKAKLEPTKPQNNSNNTKSANITNNLKAKLEPAPATIITRNLTKYLALFNQKGVYDSWDRVYYPDLISNLTIKDIKLNNQDFETQDMNQERPEYWNYLGKVEYVNSTCFEGMCLAIKINKSDRIMNDKDTGLAQINSYMIEIKEGEIYRIKLKVNCVDCKSGSVYAALIWLKNTETKIAKNSTVTINRTVEFNRNVLVINNTVGYQDLILIAKAPPEAEKMTVGLRVQIEGAVIQPTTELYLDGES